MCVNFGLFISAFSCRAGGATLPLQLAPQKRPAVCHPSPVPVDAVSESTAGTLVDAPSHVPSLPPVDGEPTPEGVPPSGEPAWPKRAPLGLIGLMPLVETAAASVDV